MAEIGFDEGCCWVWIRSHCPGDRCDCRCHVEYPLPPAGCDPMTLREVAKDLRVTATTYRKSAEVAAKRIERKHQNEIADILETRAAFYEKTAATA